MSDLSLKVGRQVDDVNGTKRALLWADTATDTQTLGDVGNFGLGRNLNTELSRPDDGARFLALLTAFLWFALVAIDNSNSCQFVRHLDRLLGSE